MAEFDSVGVANGESVKGGASLPIGLSALGGSLARWTRSKLIPPAPGVPRGVPGGVHPYVSHGASYDPVCGDQGFEITGVIRGCRLEGGVNRTTGNAYDTCFNEDVSLDLVFHLLPSAQFSEMTESKLQNEIDAFCSHFAANRGENIGGELLPDQAVFALEDDGHWLRARSDYASSNASRAHVTFLDSGKRKSVPVSRIVSVIPRPFLDIPQLTLEISFDISLGNCGNAVTPSPATVALLNHSLSGRLATFHFAPFQKRYPKASKLVIDGQQILDLKRWFN